MGRQPLPIGAHGSIRIRDVTPPGRHGGKVWEARCRFRDADGDTRQVRRTGRSRSAAENALKTALAERRHTGGDTLTGESRVRDAWELWVAQRHAEVDGGNLSPTTLAVYRSAWRLYVEPSLGGVRLREVTVARCEAWKVALRKAKGPSATKSGRTVLSGLLGYAARMGVIATNPCRDMSVIPGGPRRRPRAMTREERLGWLAAMEDHTPLLDAVAAADRAGDLQGAAEAAERLRVMRAAVRWDLPDLTRFMLATGARIGEALAVSWDEVDLTAATVVIGWRIVPIHREGLRRVSGAKSAAGVRTLRVPRWCVDMLLRRRVDERSGYPVFPDTLGGWRDPHNVLGRLRQARDAAGFGWVTSHVFRKTALTALDEAKLSARQIADVAGHSDPSMTQRVYMGRGVASEDAADALEDLL